MFISEVAAIVASNKKELVRHHVLSGLTMSADEKCYTTATTQIKFRVDGQTHLFSECATLIAMKCAFEPHDTSTLRTGSLQSGKRSGCEKRFL